MGKVFATMLLHFLISFNFICNLTMFLKNEFLPIDPIPRVAEEEGGGSAGKLFATMLLHL